MNAPVASLFDPHAASVLLANAAWVEGTLLGTLATIIAVIAVAAIGIAMFEGRVDLKRGMLVIAGCFVLFGAPVISAGLMSIVSRDEVAIARAPLPPALAVSRFISPPAPQRADFDPYAGAAVPK
jgi:type IV secretory pathway VirB2 component (pilin)